VYGGAAMNRGYGGVYRGAAISPGGLYRGAPVRSGYGSVYRGAAYAPYRGTYYRGARVAATGYGYYRGYGRYGRYGHYRRGWGWGFPLAAGLAYASYDSCIQWDGYNWINVCYDPYYYW
jgi:hypothetical protein